MPKSIVRISSHCGDLDPGLRVRVVKFLSDRGHDAEAFLKRNPFFVFGVLKDPEEAGFIESLGDSVQEFLGVVPSGRVVLILTREKRATTFIADNNLANKTRAYEIALKLWAQKFK